MLPIAKIINNKMYSLDENITSSQETYIYENDQLGWEILRRGLTFILIVACKKIDKNVEIKVMHSLNKGLFCKIVSKNILDPLKIKKEMQKLIDRSVPFKNIKMPKTEVLNILKKQNNKKDKYFLFAYQSEDIVEINELDGIYDYFYGILPPNTSFCKTFDLVGVSDNNVILLPPQRENPQKTIKIQNCSKLIDIYNERKEWAEIMGVNLISDINKIISDNNQKELIEITEALHERKIADIAKKIIDSKKRIILIAGPSSSGKTTFCHRLAIQLLTYGIKPKTISVDNYFKNNDKQKVDENGVPDFESLDALDLSLLNDNLGDMLDEKSVTLPIFNFKTGKREWDNKKTKLNKDEILLIEGLHCLNPKLTYNISKEFKYNIYISELTQLNLDNHNRIPTTDLRLCRRLIRDFYHRNTTPEQNFQLWDKVRIGEKKYIFPFQEHADSIFNSELSYELNVLKKYALPLLLTVDKKSTYYQKAQEMITMFSYVKTLEDETFIPPNSIIKEFLPQK